MTHGDLANQNRRVSFRRQICMYDKRHAKNQNPTNQFVLIRSLLDGLS